jgi:hypothetical protein
MERLRLFLFALLAAFLFIMLGQYFFFSLSLIHDIAAFPFTQTPDSRTHAAQKQKLRFTPQGTFQLAVFEDLHYGEGALPAPPKHHELPSTVSQA